MKNNLPEKYENSFFTKIKRFFANIFRKNNKVLEQNEIKKEQKTELNKTENKFQDMKKLSKKAELKKEILDMIEKQPDLIESLSIEKLKELNCMYDAIIEENERKIKKIKRELA